MADFVHLHCHTEYSLLDGAIRIKELCAKAQEFKMNACAITDHGNLYGAAYFYNICKEYEIKPIIGCEVYICHNHLDKTPDTGKKRYHLVLLAQNNAGYHNLVKLVSSAYLKGYYYRPRIDKNLLRQHSEGLICLSACLAGEIPRAILEKDMNSARKIAKEYAEIFPGRFYLELQSNGIAAQYEVNKALAEIAEIENLPLVATNDCHYLNKDDAYAHEVLLCIQTQTTIDDPGRMRFETDEFYYKSPETMAKEFSDFPAALSSTAEIADLCNVTLDFGNHYFPVYPLPAGASIVSEFRKLATEGLEKRFLRLGNDINKQLYYDRLNYELEVIEKMGFPGYFLIVQEFINWAKDNGIPVGPGRGSAAGSLVAWALRITNLDPIPYNLLFERFLNIERVSLPDIDVDFCERRRSEVIHHMIERYGEASVAQITTFGTMKAKGAVRDVGRALGISLAETDRIAKLVPGSTNMTIKQAMEKEPALDKLYKTDKKIKHLLEIAIKLEGLARHASTHAAGLVVSDKPMYEYLPLYLGKRGELVTQFDGPMTEKTGLVKFDFLGLKTMTLIQDTLDNIARQGKPVPDLESLPLNDEQTYELYSRGDTDGIFQLESSGMKQYLRMLRPNCFEDIIAMLALYRPGPLGSGMVDEFINRKHGQSLVQYPHPSLKECLQETYGVIVYQEQVMQIAQIIANYTLGGADILRRAMGKKKAEAMAKERSNFVSGAAKNDISQKLANEIFDLMEKFAEYGFNKSHSAAYALISYYTAWLKTHYQVEFMAALLSSEMNNQDKLLKYISACKDMGISVKPPSINESEWAFTANEQGIVFGLGGIKNTGDEGIRELILERQKSGPYLSLLDLCMRINKRKLSKRMLESLIKGGACDCFGISRAAMLACQEIAAAKAQKSLKTETADQNFLLAPAVTKSQSPPNGLGIEIPEAYLKEMDEDQKLKNEKEALGFFLTSHPLQPYSRAIKQKRFCTIDNCAEHLSGATLDCAVLITSIKEVVTKKNKSLMAFVSIEDLTGHAEVTFFPHDYTTYRELLNSDKPLLITAKLEKIESAENMDNAETEQPQEIKLIGKSVYLLEKIIERNIESFSIDIPAKKLNDKDLSELRSILSSHAGKMAVEAWVNFENYRLRLMLGKDLSVTPDKSLDAALFKWAN